MKERKFFHEQKKYFEEAGLNMQRATGLLRISLTPGYNIMDLKNVLKKMKWNRVFCG